MCSFSSAPTFRILHHDPKLCARYATFNRDLDSIFFKSSHRTAGRVPLHRRRSCVSLLKPRSPSQCLSFSASSHSNLSFFDAPYTLSCCNATISLFVRLGESMVHGYCRNVCLCLRACRSGGKPCSCIDLSAQRRAWSLTFVCGKWLSMKPMSLMSPGRT